MSESDHEYLIDMIKGVEGMVLLSGYDNPLYNTLGWKRYDMDWTCFASHWNQDDAKRVESLWYNYDLPI